MEYPQKPQNATPFSKKVPPPTSTKFPALAGWVQKFPALAGGVQKFPALAGWVKKFPALAGGELWALARAYS